MAVRHLSHGSRIFRENEVPAREGSGPVVHSLSPKVLIVDDHPLMRKGLALALEEGGTATVCGQVADAEESLDLVGTRRPDLVLVDISLPGMSGLELVKQLRSRSPEVAILVVSRHDEELYAERVIRAGARGYVSKLEAPEVIVEAVRRVLAGGVYVSSAINERLLTQIAESGRRFGASSPLEVLSDRELEVFEQTGEGRSTRQIADRLHLSVKTVESYRARIKKKLDLDSASELLRHAVQWVEE